MEINPIIFLVAAFIAVVYLLAKTKKAAVALFVGCGIMSLYPGISLHQTIKIFYSTLLKPRTINLMIVVLLISVLGRIMGDSKMMLGIVERLQGLIKSKKVILGLIPAIIGLLPVMGGAYMSAPLIDQASQNVKIDNARKTTVNLIFRHILYPVFPLYPPLILIQDMAGINMYDMIKINLIPFAVALVGSYFFLLSPLKVQDETGEYKFKWTDLGMLFYYASPIIIVVGIAVIWNQLVLATILSIIWTLLVSTKGNFSELKRYIKDSVVPGLNWNLSLVIFGALLFQQFVVKSGSVEMLAHYFDVWNFPLLLLAVVLPFIVGILTGSTLAAIGILLPIFQPFFNSGYGMGLLVLIFFTTMAGYIVSPMHLCLILTHEYFGGEIKRVYSQSGISVLLLVAGAIGLWLVF